MCNFVPLTKIRLRSQTFARCRFRRGIKAEEEIKKSKKRGRQKKMAWANNGYGRDESVSFWICRAKVDEHVSTFMRYPSGFEGRIHRPVKKSICTGNAEANTMAAFNSTLNTSGNHRPSHDLQLFANFSAYNLRYSLWWWNILWVSSIMLMSLGDAKTIEIVVINGSGQLINFQRQIWREVLYVCSLQGVKLSDEFRID